MTLPARTKQLGRTLASNQAEREFIENCALFCLILILILRRKQKQNKKKRAREREKEKCVCVCVAWASNLKGKQRKNKKIAKH